MRVTCPMDITPPTVTRRLQFQGFISHTIHGIKLYILVYFTSKGWKYIYQPHGWYGYVSWVWDLQVGSGRDQGEQFDFAMENGWLCETRKCSPERFGRFWGFLGFPWSNAGRFLAPCEDVEMMVIFNSEVVAMFEENQLNKFFRPYSALHVGRYATDKFGFKLIECSKKGQKPFPKSCLLRFMRLLTPLTFNLVYLPSN